MTVQEDGKLIGRDPVNIVVDAKRGLWENTGHKPAEFKMEEVVRYLCLYAALILTGSASSTALQAQTATELGERGMERIENGDLDGGIADLDQALKADPTYAEAYFARGFAWNKKDEFDKAIADFTQAIRLEPNQPDPRYNRGRMWEKKGEYDKAIADYREAFRLNPGNFRVCNNLAWIYATCPIDKYRDGKKALENALRAHRQYGSDHWRLAATVAAAYAENGDYHEARVWQTKAMALIGDDGSVTDKDKQSLQSRLELYKANKPYREPDKAR